MNICTSESYPTPGWCVRLRGILQRFELIIICQKCSSKGFCWILVYFYRFRERNWKVNLNLVYSCEPQPIQFHCLRPFFSTMVALMYLITHAFISRKRNTPKSSQMKYKQCDTVRPTSHALNISVKYDTCKRQLYKKNTFNWMLLLLISIFFLLKHSSVLFSLRTCSTHTFVVIIWFLKFCNKKKYKRIIIYNIKTFKRDKKKNDPAKKQFNFHLGDKPILEKFPLCCKTFNGLQLCGCKKQRKKKIKKMYNFTLGKLKQHGTFFSLRKSNKISRKRWREKQHVKW